MEKEPRIEKISELADEQSQETLSRGKEPELTADEFLKEVVRKEVALKIQENFGQRKEVDEFLTVEQGVDKKVTEKRLSLVFDYLKDYLALGETLDRVVQEGVLGTVKKRWSIVLDKIEDLLNQLSPEMKGAVEKSIEAMYRKRQKLDKFLKETKPEDVFSEIVGDDKGSQPRGAVRVKTSGDILNVCLPNREDFAKAFWGPDRLNQENLKKAKNIGGFATSCFLEPVESDVDMIVFSREPKDVYRSTLSHEVSHRIFSRLFKNEALKGKGKEDFKNPHEFLGSILKYWWTRNALKDELWNQTLSGLMHYDNYSGSGIEKILDKHVGCLAEKGEDAHYDYPRVDKLSVVDRIREFFPDMSKEEADEMYENYAEKYYRFAEGKINFVKDHLSALPLRAMRYDFLNLLRFENIDKWTRIPRFLELIGRNSESAKRVLKSKYGEPFLREAEKSGDDDLKSAMNKLWQFDWSTAKSVFLKKDSSYEEDQKLGKMREEDTGADAKALIFLRWVNDTQIRSRQLLKKYKHKIAK